MKRNPIRSLRDIRGMQQARIRSIPKQQRSAHLDLYVTAREKVRLNAELGPLRAKIALIEKRLAQTDEHMTELVRDMGLQPDAKTAKSGQTSRVPVKKIRMEY